MGETASMRLGEMASMYTRLLLDAWKAPVVMPVMYVRDTTVVIVQHD